MFRTAFLVVVAVAGLNACERQSAKMEPRVNTQAPDTNGTMARVDADNTKRNAGDVQAGALTPMDQSNSAPDLALTQQIRKAVVDSDALSMSAKNVKIITRDAQVTLRGAVQTEAERNAIESMARTIAGEKAVTNQIEIAANNNPNANTN